MQGDDNQPPPPPEDDLPPWDEDAHERAFRQQQARIQEEQRRREEDEQGGGDPQQPEGGRPPWGVIAGGREIRRQQARMVEALRDQEEEEEDADFGIGLNEDPNLNRRLELDRRQRERNFRLFYMENNFDEPDDTVDAWMNDLGFIIIMRPGVGYPIEQWIQMAIQGGMGPVRNQERLTNRAMEDRALQENIKEYLKSAYPLRVTDETFLGHAPEERIRAMICTRCGKMS